jgi:hypothetical protein
MRLVMSPFAASGYTSLMRKGSVPRRTVLGPPNAAEHRRRSAYSSDVYPFTLTLIVVRVLDDARFAPNLLKLPAHPLARILAKSKMIERFPRIAFRRGSVRHASSRHGSNGIERTRQQCRPLANLYITPPPSSGDSGLAWRAAPHAVPNEAALVLERLVREAHYAEERSTQGDLSF